MITPSMMGTLGWKGYLVFTVFNFAFIPFLYVFYPETSGRRLEEIDAIFYKTSPIVAGTEWAKRGHFESNHLEEAFRGAEESKYNHPMVGVSEQVENTEFTVKN